MSFVVLAFLVMVSAFVEVTVPPLRWMGYAAWPLMMGVVIYYALMRPRSAMLQAAILGGLLEDSLSLMPLGYSSFCYCVIGLVVEQFKDIVLVREWTTHVVLGALSYPAMTLVTFILLFKDGLVDLNLPWLALRLTGSVVLGAVVVPPVFKAAERVDHMVGNVEFGET